MIGYAFCPFPRAHLNRLDDVPAAALHLYRHLADLLLSFQQREGSYSNEFLCRRVGCSDNTLRASRELLVERGVLEVSGGGPGRKTFYRFVNLELERVQGPPERVVELRRPRASSPSRSGEGWGRFGRAAGGGGPEPESRSGVREDPAVDCGSMYIEKRREEEDHHAGPVRPAESPVAPAAPEAAPSPPPALDDVSSQSSESKESGELVERLRAEGVHGGMARRLAAEAPPDVIRRALENLAHRQVKNRAAWLVQEIRDGGYEAPEAVRQTRSREEVQARRRAEERSLTEARDREAERIRGHVEGVLARLSEGERAELVRVARGRLGPWAGRLAQDEGSPLLRAEVSAVVLERWPLGLGLARAS